jgi:hypothetical protein
MSVNSVTVTGISLRRGSIAWSPLSPNLTVLENWTTISRNGHGFLVNSVWFRFYGNILVISNTSIFMGRKSYVTDPDGSVI